MLPALVERYAYGSPRKEQVTLSNSGILDALRNFGRSSRNRRRSLAQRGFLRWARLAACPRDLALPPDLVVELLQRAVGGQGGRLHRPVPGLNEISETSV